MLTLRTIDAVFDRRWDDFVSRHPSGVIYHRSAWAQVIAATYGHTPLYIALEETRTGELAGAAPFFIVKSPLTGERVVSPPFATFCDPLVPPSGTADMAAFIFDRVPTARHIKMKLLDFKLDAPSEVLVSSSYVTHFIDLRPGLDELFNAFHVSSVRQRIRRAERNGITFRWGQSEADLRGFYRLHKGVRQRHGLPPQPYAFFKNMWIILGAAGLLNLGVVEHEGKLVAGSIVLKSGHTYHHEYSASEEASWKLCSNQKLLWEIIKTAHADGARYMDLGRSEMSNVSLIEYKERWQGKRLHLSYCTLPAPSVVANERNGSGLLKRSMEFLNRRMPGRLLEWEGRLIYPHRD